MLYLFVALKLPIVAAGLIVWWAVRRTPEPDEVPERRRRRARRCGRIRPAACRAPPRRGPARRPAAAAAAAGPARAARGPAASSADAATAPCSACARQDDRSGRPRPEADALRHCADGHVRAVRRHDPPARRRGPHGHRPVGPRAWCSPRPSTCGSGDSFRVFHNHRAAAIDLRDPPQNLTEEVVTEGDEPFVIHPGEFALGRTQEHVEIPDDIVARIEGKSSLGRLGLIVHATAGFVDPGLQGHADARDHEPHARPDQALRRPPDRPALVHGARRAGRAAVRLARARLPLPGPDGRDRVPLRPRGAVACRPCCRRSSRSPSRPPRRSRTRRSSTSLGGAARRLGGRHLVRRPAQRRLPELRRGRGRA